MLKDYIEDYERLFRAIKPFPNLWKFDVNRPSSAAFKDSLGLSVDRKGTRTVERVIERFKKRFEIMAVVSLTAKECREFQTCPIAKPEPDNPEHAEIHGSLTEVALTSGKARKLSKIARIDHLNITLS
ncbi:MAG: hypothetical protein KJ607_06905 [Bacteroidetes bacterium]|nr:hypothetical protein [Bacteroidota bacterium]